MKAASVMRNLSLYKGSQFTLKRVEGIATELRKAEILPKAGRGPNAPDVTCEQAAIFAIAVASAERVADAASVARDMADLVDKQGVRLASAVAVAICNDTAARDIRHVRLIAESKMGEITMRDGYVRHFFHPTMWRDKLFAPDAQGQGFVGRIGHIGGAALAQMALDHVYNDSEETGELIS